jgi:hypothetical protein
VREAAGERRKREPEEGGDDGGRQPHCASVNERRVGRPGRTVSRAGLLAFRAGTEGRTGPLQRGADRAGLEGLNAVAQVERDGQSHVRYAGHVSDVLVTYLMCWSRTPICWSRIPCVVTPPVCWSRIPCHLADVVVNTRRPARRLVRQRRPEERLPTRPRRDAGYVTLIVTLDT